MIRPARPDDMAALLALAEATGLFQPEELEGFGGMMQAHLDPEGEGDDVWIVDSDEAGILGAAYYAPEAFADGVWNLYFIGVHPTEQGKGRGTALLTCVEQALIERKERILLVETSGVDGFELTRAFYRKNGYDEEARIRDFYSPGDDKVIFRKALTAVV
ncbi:MAG: GNAT family N-acetyltransferase [Phormidesmis sp.]